MSDLSNCGENYESSGTSENVYTLPLPSINDEGARAAYEYLVEIGEVTPGQQPTGEKNLTDLVYRLTIELARARAWLRIERTIGDDLLDENEMLLERIEMFSTQSGVDEDSITELMMRVELAEDMADCMASSLDWDKLLGR